MMRSKIGVLMLAPVVLGLALTTACKPKKYMLHDTFVPDHAKVARYSVKPVGTVGTDRAALGLSNYYIQICDVQGDVATNCKTTMVLANITDFLVFGGAAYNQY